MDNLPIDNKVHKFIYYVHKLRTLRVGIWQKQIYKWKKTWGQTPLIGGTIPDID